MPINFLSLLPLVRFTVLQNDLDFVLLRSGNTHSTLSQLCIFTLIILLIPKLTKSGAIADADSVAEALKSGHLLGYAGDVWNVQPAPKDHPWRTMANPHGGGNGMVPHMSGTTLDAQKRYADGTKEIIRRYLAGEKQDPANLIVENGEYASKAYGQRATATGQKGAGP